MHEKYFTTIGPIKNVKNLEAKFKKYEKEFESGRWIFRGQNNVDGHLSPSLERLSKKLPEIIIKKINKEIKEKSEGNSYRRFHYIEYLELGLLRKFQRQYHHYVTKSPDEKKLIEWFAIMQHYGVPTRLLDWTYSFHVATFFAIENLLKDKKNNCEIWALDMGWLIKKVYEIYPDLKTMLDREDTQIRKLENFNKINTKKLVIAVNPFALNERLAIQQGVFLMPGDVTSSFMNNLIALDNDGELHNNLIKFTLSFDDAVQRIAIIKKLQKMNMTRVSLFPGIDGFSQSLEFVAFAMAEIFSPGDFYNTVC